MRCEHSSPSSTNAWLYFIKHAGSAITASTRRFSRILTASSGTGWQTLQQSIVTNQVILPIQTLSISDSTQRGHYDHDKWSKCLGKPWKHPLGKVMRRHGLRAREALQLFAANTVCLVIGSIVDLTDRQRSSNPIDYIAISSTLRSFLLDVQNKIAANTGPRVR